MTFTEEQQKAHREAFINECRQKAWGAACHADWVSKGLESQLSTRSFIVTHMARHADNVVAFHNQRGTCEQWIKEGKGAIKWTSLSCWSFAANAVRLQLHALAYNLGNFLRTLTPEPIKDWSLTSLKEPLCLAENGKLAQIIVAVIRRISDQRP